MNEYHLYIDELGTPDPSDGLSEVYILCGCAIPEFKREILKNKADQIKFKYWDKTDFAFHSRELEETKVSIKYLKKIIENEKPFSKIY